MVRRGEQSLILFLFGGVGYSLLEIFWRGFTHWTMFVLGGICFVLLSRLSVSCCGRVPMWACCFGSAVLITSLECLELLRPAAESAGPDLPRVQRIVVFTQRPAAGAVLLAVQKIGRQLSNRVALGITAAAAQLFARLAAGKSII